MAKKQRQGLTKRFGARYGRTVKNKLDKVESQAKAKYSCPYCASKTVTRKQAGIWNCKKCNKNEYQFFYHSVELNCKIWFNPSKRKFELANMLLFNCLDKNLASPPVKITVKS